MTSRPARPLAWRLSLIIVVVVVAVVALFAGLMMLITTSDLNSLEAQRAANVRSTLTAAAVLAYRRSGDWTGADLLPVLNLANDAGASVKIIDTQGNVIVTGGAIIHTSTAAVQLSTIAVGNNVVGDLLVTVPNFPSEIAQVRERLGVAALLVGGLSVVLGVIVAVYVARRITRPITELTGAVHAVNEGETEVRVGHLSSSLELRDLGDGFDVMAATLERQERLRNNLVADVAHELRTPLSVLQASCEAMVDGVTPPSQELATSMLHQVHRLGQRIADLDALTAAESASLRLARTPVDLDGVVGEVVAAVSPRFADAHVTLTTSLQPAIVLGDGDRLHQVMTNLLVNAAKFTPPGGSVHVSVATENGDGVVRVADTGIGLDAAELDHVFDRFWRGTASAGTPGSGVGLAIASELVHAHRGTITATSGVGRGTEFVVRLPRP